jgi:hypothetical protein
LFLLDEIGDGFHPFFWRAEQQEGIPLNGITGRDMDGPKIQRYVRTVFVATIIIMLLLIIGHQEAMNKNSCA